jgi:hypothetical protein
LLILITSLTGMTSCDRVFHDCIEVGGAETKISSEEKDRALRVIDAFSLDESLECKRTDSPLIMDSYDTSLYELRECWEPKSFVTVQFAIADEHIVVEMMKIGSSRPEFMRRAQQTLAEGFSSELGRGLVSVRQDCYREGHRLTGALSEE